MTDTLTHIQPDLILAFAVNEREMAYQAALELIAEIDDHCQQGTRHYRNRAGVLLTSLDEVVRAILDNDLKEAEAA